MVYNYYLEEAKKKAQLQKDKALNTKPSVQQSARLPNIANGNKSKPRNFNQQPRNWPPSMSSRVSNRTVNIAEPPRNQKPFLKSKDLACDAKRQKFSPNKSSAVYLKTTPPRSGLTWKLTGTIFTQVGLKWIPIRKSVETRYNTNDSASPLGKETHNPNTVICANSSSLSAGTSMASEPISSKGSSNVKSETAFRTTFVFRGKAKKGSKVPEMATQNSGQQTAGEVTTASTKLLLLEEVTTASGKTLLEDMDQDFAHMVAASKVPMLKPGEFELWRMRIEQYIQMIDYALWEVIENGATLLKTQMVEGVMTFNSIKDAKQLLEAVEKRFGGNAATKKTQRNLLKQQYENFTAPSSEMLDQTFNRLQKLVSQLDLLDEKNFTRRC
ncbi:hypothetical protein Tco_0370073 [Tanacetum coccineum]